MSPLATSPATSSVNPAGPAVRRPSTSWWRRHAAPREAYLLAGRWWPWFAAAALVLTASGLFIGFGLAPTDHQQGEAYRIIYLHVPVAWLSMVIYVAMAFWAGAGLVLNTRVSAMMAQALAPTGALMAFLSLWTGALWGRPTWGTWWVWDARLTSVVILLFLYLGFMALHAAIDDARRADRASGLLALVGVVNVPVIYFSVQWWNTLHQGATINLRTGISMAPVMVAGLLVTTAGVWAYAIAATLVRFRAVVLERERHAAWPVALTQEARR